MRYQYPKVRRDDSAIDDYNGIKVPDPYQWLEDPDAEETKAFVEAQNAVTMPFIEACDARGKLQERITAMWDFPKYTCPFKRGSKYFYRYNTGLQNQSVLYVQDSLEAEATVFLDPNSLSEDGTISLGSTCFSEDGALFAYSLSDSGSDWITIKFKKVEGNEDLPDVLSRCKFSCMAWTHDNAGFFYNSFPKQEGKTDGTETTSNLHQKLFYHKLGTAQSEDILCGEFPDNPKWMGGAEVSDCGRYVVLAIREGCDPVNRLWYCDLKALPEGITGLLPWVKVVDNFDAEYEYITNEGSVLTFKTNLDAPKYKLINIDLEKPEKENWRDLVAEENDVLEWSACVHSNKLVLCYLQDVKSVLRLHKLEDGSKITTFPLDVGTVVGYSGRKKDTEVFYQFSSFLTPGIIYRCNLAQETLTPSVFKSIQVKEFDPSGFETKQVFFSSKDGTKIPMFIVHKKGMTMDGSHPVLQYGYGGFNIPICPSFSVSRIVFMSHLGGVLAVPNIRGGGEYGETWHQGGMLANKQNVFDDFAAAAEYLIENKYTSANLITINGGSNGGLLVGACCNQRPELFGCIIAQVGVMDMLKFHKFTIGHAWTTDFGNPDKPEQFEYIRKYSPLHNVRVPEGDGVQYPAMLLLTGDHDDRVVPLHSLKHIAEIQHVLGACPKQTNPLMIRVDTKSGHGAGKPTTKIIEEHSDIYSFIVQNLGLKWKE